MMPTTNEPQHKRHSRLPLPETSALARLTLAQARQDRAIAYKAALDVLG